MSQAARRPSRLREISGQLIFDKPWSCSFCERDYRGKRCHKIRIWQTTRAQDGSLKHIPHELRLCVTDRVVQGCWEMGIAQLVRRRRS
jgi:hypothetical protein